MNYRDYTIDLLAQIASNTAQAKAADLHSHIDLGQKIHRTIKMRRRAAWLIRLRNLAGQSVGYTGQPCATHPEHQSVIVGEGGEILCPIQLWLRICAVYIESKQTQKLMEWKGQSQRYVKPV